MRILFNSYFPSNPTSSFYAAGLGKIQDVTINNFNNYNNFDIALFPSYKKDLDEIKIAKRENPELKIGVVDPRSEKLISNYLDHIDFFVVDSIEMYDFWLNFCRPVHIYYEFPDIPVQERDHSHKDKIIVGYHGNKVHLTSMFPRITLALEKLGEKYDITLNAIYNISELGKWEIGRPKNITIKDIQWTEESYLEELKNCDIGLIPSLVPIKKSSKKKSLVSRFFLGNEDDYLIRFKMLSNPGRLIVFSLLKIPVVADFSPSHLNFIENRKNGFLAYSSGGWFNALETLIKDFNLRNKMSQEMIKTYHEFFDHEKQNISLLYFLEKIYKSESTLISSSKFDSENILELFKFNNAYSFDKLKKIYNKIFKN